MIYLLYTIHVLVCLFLILVVLLQQGKGADLSVFGGGATQAAFGARGAVNLLHKLTVSGFVAFIITTVSIGFMTSAKKTSSVLSGLPEGETAAPTAAVETEAAPAEETSAEEAGAIEPEPAPEGDAGTEAGETGEGEPPESAEEDGGDDEGGS